MFDQIAGWSSITGALIGLLGLIFSLLAFEEAKRAKNAAQYTEQRVEEVKSALRDLRSADL